MFWLGHLLFPKKQVLLLGLLKVGIISYKIMRGEAVHTFIVEDSGIDDLKYVSTFLFILEYLFSSFHGNPQ